MHIERLEKMANDVAAYFAAEPDPADGVTGVARHLQSFWERRMREQLDAHILATGGAGLHPLVLEAFARLRRPTPPG